MNKKLMVFDCFGVISSEVADKWLYSFFSKEEAEAIHKGIITDADAGRISDKELFEEISKLTGVAPEQILRDWLDLSVIDREVVKIIAELREKYTVVLLSNAFTPFIGRIFKENDLDGCFDRMFISDKLGMAKPDPEIFKHVLSEMNVCPEDATMIDDNATNISVAASVGMNTILFKDAFSLRKELGI